MEQRECNLYVVACHEAAHAVVGYVVGLVIEYVEVEVRNENNIGFGGRCIIDWEGRELRELLSIKELIKNTICGLAGVVFTSEIITSPHYPQWLDESINLSEVELLKKRAKWNVNTIDLYTSYEKCARTLVSKYKTEIELVGDILSKEHYISGKKLSEVMDELGANARRRG